MRLAMKQAGATYESASDGNNEVPSIASRRAAAALGTCRP
eukprot:SAG31_NODE_32812_length_351_cov_0.857143_1_plen_39_part_10